MNETLRYRNWAGQSPPDTGLTTPLSVYVGWIPPKKVCVFTISEFFNSQMSSSVLSVRKTRRTQWHECYYFDTILRTAGMLLSCCSLGPKGHIQIQCVENSTGINQFDHNAREIINQHNWNDTKKIIQNNEEEWDWGMRLVHDLPCRPRKRA